MKGFMIYETPLWGDEENVVYVQEVGYASYTLKQIGSDNICHLEGMADGPITKAKCNKDDTYDFETGALIALMKKCGVDKVVRACNEAFSEDTFKTYATKYERELNELKKDSDKVIDKLIEEIKTLKKEKEQIIVAKNVLYNKLEKENEKLKKRINELENYNNQLEDRVAAEQRGGYKFLKDMEKLQHDYDLCKNSENALKCSVEYLNKTIAKLNNAIYGYKEDLYKVTKRCEELEIKESTLNKQQEQLDKREEKLSVYFVGRENGKQLKALVTLFKKIDKKKVQEAYKEAYGDRVIWCTSQPSIRDFGEQINKLTVDSLIEESRAFTRKCVDEWLYKIPTKREEMWEKIFELHKESDVIIKVKREDINTFLHELENRIPEITWASCVKIFETKYTIKDIYFALKTCDTIYFRLSKETTLSYSIDAHIYLYRELKSIDYLPPMRWDLFKKGRIVVGVRKEHYEEFKEEITRQFGVINIHKPYERFNYSFFMYDKNADFVEAIGRSQFRAIKEMNNHKVVYWEDVR